MALDSNVVSSSPVMELGELIHTPEGKLRAEITLDLSALDFFGQKPIIHPVTVRATVSNRGGALHLLGDITSDLSLCCDRCQTSFTREKQVLLNHLLAQTLEDEEHDEILLLEGTSLNLGDVATTAFILEMDTKTLCSEACAGLCPTCGTNLNEGACSCQKNNDSPFAVLASLLED